jgi:hypothetical protein
MHTLVQDGITPLTVDQMEVILRAVDVFLDEARFEGPVRFDQMAVVMLEDDDFWPRTIGRQPTQLELMSACCILETLGRLRFDIIEGLMHVATIPCGRGE